MDRITVRTPKHSVEDGKSVISAAIDLGTRSAELHFRVSQGPVAEDSEPFLAAALLPALRLGLPLQMASAISPRLMKTISTISDIFCSWDRSLYPISLDAQPKQVLPENVATGVACFFSGGVDSFYTILKHPDEITQLIFVHGFDLSLDATSLRAKVAKEIRAAAAELEKPLIEVETNIHELLDPYVTWNLAHGAAMASVALLLSPQFRKVFIAASHTYAELIPLGSHPLLDPLWGTENLAIVHDGCESTRIGKVARIAESDLALRYLRVCWKNFDGAYNCGRCGKCLFTMVALRLAGALERCATFDRPLDLDAVAHMDISNASRRLYMQQNLEAAESHGDDPALAQALRACLHGHDANRGRGARRTLRHVRENIERLCHFRSRGMIDASIDYRNRQ